jgi:hypothetical protein
MLSEISEIITPVELTLAEGSPNTPLRLFMSTI